MTRTPMTPRGHAALKEELHQLKTVERPRIIQDIAEARAHGDLSENAEYDAAKERQSFIEGRIREVESKLSNCEIIDPAAQETDRIVFGATVVLSDIDDDGEVTWQIVGDDEADTKAGRISVSSPVARALIGRRSGDEVEVRAPGGSRTYEVISIRYE